jgi:hypothetical protein
MSQDICTKLEHQEIVFIENHLLQGLVDLSVMFLTNSYLVSEIQSLDLLSRSLESFENLGVRSQVLLEKPDSVHKHGVLGFLVTDDCQHVEHEGIDES